MTSGRQLARNTAFNMVAQIAPVVVAIWAVRVLIHQLGPDRFAVLALAWAAIGYFSFFDLGLGRALTQAVSAELRSDRPERLGELSVTALAWMAGLGLVGALVLSSLTPWLVDHALKIPPTLVLESRWAFLLLAASLPFVVTTAGLRGLLEAHQHFGLATALRLPYALLTFLGPLCVLPWSHSLVPIVAVLVIGRVALWAAHVLVCFRQYAFLRGARVRDFAATIGLLRMGGWMTVSNVISPMMVTLDRFVIGAIISLAAVAYYVTPLEMVTKLLLIPSAILGVMFPAWAETYTMARERTGELFDSALRLMLLVMFPLSLIFVGCAGEILKLWVGADLAAHSRTIMEILTIGIFINSAGMVPFGALQAMGRPDLTAKLHLAELPLYVFAIFSLGSTMGLTGIALAWTLRIAVDTAVLCLLVRDRVIGARRSVRRALSVLVLLTVCLAIVATPPSFGVRAGILAAMLLAFVPAAWSLAMTEKERHLFRRAILAAGPFISGAPRWYLRGE